ncbi:hypothetical protein ACQUW5_01985 [Legionella sp. CNM-1927-20]|uniref:hypothetical protein n=1 Tax=Legionella sp. CNM-1927-20 TaxID=3422221 RepID=UPI00403AD9D5
MSYSNVTDSPLGQFLLSVEERLKSAKNNSEFKADKSEAAKETANQINKLLKLIDQLRSVMNIYNRGGGPGLSDLFVLPKLISLRNLSRDYASPSYQLYRFLKKNLANISQTAASQFLLEIPENEVDFTQKLDHLKEQINAALLKNATIQSLSAQTIIDDLLKNTNFSFFTPAYIKGNKNNFIKDITQALLGNFKQQYLNSLLQRYAFQIKHPIMFDVIADLSKLLSTLPKDDFSKLVPFLDPAAIENTSKLMNKPIIHKGRFAFEVSETKNIIDINGLYEQYAPHSYQLIDSTIADYFRDFAETQKVKSEKAKGALIQGTVGHLVQDCKTTIANITLQIKSLTMDQVKPEQYSKTSLYNLIHKLDELKQLQVVTQEYLVKYKNALIQRIHSKTFLSEIIKESHGHLTPLFVNYQKFGLTTHSMQELLTTTFVNISSDTLHLMTVKEYIDNIFNSFQLEIGQLLNQAKKELVAQMKEIWRKWIDEERDQYLKATTTISDCCKEMKTKAEQFKLEIDIPPEDLELKLDYIAKKFTELDSQKHALQTLQQELDLQEKKLKELSANTAIPEDLVTLFSDEIQKEFHHWYETEQNHLVEIKTAIKQIEMTLIEQDSVLRMLDEKIQFEKKMSEGNVNELKGVLESRLQALNDLRKNFNHQQLQEKQEELKSIQTLTPREELDVLQKRVNNNMTAFREVLEDFSKPLTILNSSISTEKRNEIIEVLEQLVELDRLAVIKYIETLGQVHEDDIKNNELVELYRIYNWIDKQLIPAAKQDLSISQVRNLFEGVKEFNSLHLNKLFFDIICPDVKINKPNHWKEFYQRLRLIFHPSIFQSETARANNTLKLNQLKKLAAEAHKILALTSPLKDIINKLKNLDKKIAEDKADIVTLEQEIQLQEDINNLQKKEKQLFTLNQEIQILDKLITLSEEIQFLGREMNDLKDRLTNSPAVLDNFGERQFSIEAYHESLQVINQELQELGFLLKLTDFKDYQVKFKQLNHLCLELQNNLTAMTNAYHNKITQFFDLKIKEIQTAKDEFNQLVKVYLQKEEPSATDINTLFNKLKDIEKEVEESKKGSKIMIAKIKPIEVLSLQESISTVNADSAELAVSLVKKLQDYINSLIHQAKEKGDRITINIIDEHKEDINKMYRQELDAANLLMEKANLELLKLKAVLSKDKLAECPELIRNIEDIEKSSDKVKNELIVKQGCVSSAQSRILARIVLADRFKQELDNYLTKRARKFNFKDTFTSKDSRARELFIKGSSTEDGLKNFLDNFIKDGNSQKLVKFINTNKSYFPGQQLQPLLNRLIIAVRDYEKTLPIDYSDDLSSEVYWPAVNLERAKSVLDSLQKNNTTNALARGIKRLYDDIKVMHNYGIEINSDDHLKGITSSSGQTAVSLANRLRKNLDEFLVKNEEALIRGGIVRKHLLLLFHENFKTLLHSEDDKLSKHREAWKPILANIALNVFTLIKLVVSKIATHQATFFFQKTERMQKVDAVEQSLDKVVQSNLSLI